MATVSPFARSGGIDEVWNLGRDQTVSSSLEILAFRRQLIEFPAL